MSTILVDAVVELIQTTTADILSYVEQFHVGSLGSGVAVCSKCYLRACKAELMCVLMLQV